MKKLFLLLILMAVSVSFAQAATVETKAGTKAMLFQFSGLSDLGVSGYLTSAGVGLRYYVQDDLAIRPGVSFTYAKHENKAVTPSTEVKDTGFGINCGIEKHIGPAANVSPYLGAMAGFNYAKHTPAGDNPVETKVQAFNIGVLGGFEYGFTDNLSLGGEYMLGASFGSTETDDSPRTIDSSDTTFGVSTVSLFLSVYWP